MTGPGKPVGRALLISITEQLGYSADNVERITLTAFTVEVVTCDVTGDGVPITRRHDVIDEEGEVQP